MQRISSGSVDFTNAASFASAGPEIDVDVRLVPSAWRSLRSMARTSPLRETIDVVVGGEERDELITLVEAIPCVQDRGPSHCQLDAARALELAQEKPVIGTAHLHHVRDEFLVSDTGPSPGDFDAWSLQRRALNLERFVGVLVYRYADRTVDLDAYIVQAGPLGKDVARRARSIDPLEEAPTEADRLVTPAHLLQMGLTHQIHAERHIERLPQVADDPASVAWHYQHAASHQATARQHIQRAIDHLSEHPSDPAVFAQEIDALPQLPSDDGNGNGTTPAP